VIILYEDEWLIAIDKPAGLPSQPTRDPARPSAQSELQAFLTARDGKPPYLALHHRLDRDTSGVLLFVRDPKANAGVGALFSGKTARKIYQALAVLRTVPPETWEVRNHLGVVGRTGKVERFGAVRSGGSPAHTRFRILERLGDAALIEAQPATGRTHQIRVHLAEGGQPILGDTLYGGPDGVRDGGGRRVIAPRILLHAGSLSFRHPLTNANLTLTSPLPADFQACLEPLRSRP